MKAKLSNCSIRELCRFCNSPAVYKWSKIPRMYMAAVYIATTNGNRFRWEQPSSQQVDLPGLWFLRWVDTFRSVWAYGEG